MPPPFIVTKQITETLNGAANNKLLKGVLFTAGIAITVFSLVSLYNQVKMHKVLYQKALLDIENYKNQGVTLPPPATK